jgi:hypothetical protein
MSIRAGFACAAVILLYSAPAALFAQWLDYPTAGVPRTPDRKPDLAAPVPRTADGKPDLSGMYGWVTAANCGAMCNDTQISREFANIAANRKDPALAFNTSTTLGTIRAADDPKIMQLVGKFTF